MAELRKIVPSPALSDFRQMVKPGPSVFDTLADVAETAYNWLEPAAVEEMKRSGMATGMEAGQSGGGYYRSGTPAAPAAPKKRGPEYTLGADELPQWETAPGGYVMGQEVKGYIPEEVKNGIFAGESGGDYNALFGFSNRPGGRFENVRLTDMTINEALEFASPDGDYGQTVKGQIGRVATPMGAYQIVGTTLRAARDGLGLSGDERMTPETQDRLAGWIYETQGVGAWEGYKGPRDSYTPASGGPAVTMSTAGGQPAVMVRTSKGTVEPRLYSPLSGPILQAHNAAAGVAYVSEKMVQGQTDLIGMAGEFALNPEGFRQAAEAYIGQMVQDAPEQFRADLMMEMRGQAQKTFLGIVEDQQRDTRQRAANSSAALVDRWSTDYADAIASGDMAAAGDAEAKLRGALRARESLPGLAWTPEQSENVILGARAAAEKAVAARQKEVESGFKDTLNTIIDAAKSGMTAADEAILGSPIVQNMLPDLWREASAFVTLRDQIPTFNMMTPAQQSAALAEMKSQPVTEQWETDLYGAAEKVAADNAKAWMDDPIKRAGEVLTDDPPPPIPELDVTNPEAFMAALGERAVYANRLTEAGYVERKVYVSKDEAKTLGGLFAKDVPPELKAMAAGAIVGAMGDDAAGFFRQIKTNDPIIPHVGALMARGGDTTVAVEAMTGQAYLDQKVVPAPSAAAVAAGRAPVDAALRAAPGATEAMAGISKTATAIYAARVPANADEETQAQVMQEAWQAALGQHDDLGILRGGVQEVGGQPVLLPPTVAGEDLERAMEKAFTGRPIGAGEAFGLISPFADTPRDIDGGMWIAAAGAIPVLGGSVLDPAHFQNGEITLTPVGGSRYMLSVTRNGVVVDVGALGQPDDVPFIFDAEALIAASLVPK